MTIVIHYTRDDYNTCYRVWLEGWSGDNFVMVSPQDFMALCKLTRIFSFVEHE